MRARCGSSTSRTAADIASGRPDEGRDRGHGRRRTDPRHLDAAGGQVWVGAYNGGALTHIDEATGEATEVTVDAQPEGMLVTPDAVWVADFLSRSLLRVDPATGEVVATIEVGREPEGVVEGAGLMRVACAGDGTVVAVGQPRTRSPGRSPSPTGSATSPRRGRPVVGSPDEDLVCRVGVG